MKTKIKKNLIIVLATLFLFAFFVLSALPLTNANADGETIYTNVMDDLKKDEKFNTDDYPAVKDDYSLKVIQIAESSAKELFVYTYQPAHATQDLIATSINISTGTGNELSYWNYELRLLSTNGVFDKYLVKDFKVSTEEVRTYDISNIYRAWNKDIDEATGNDNTISEVGFKVGKCFYCKTDENGNVLYDATETEVVVVTSRRVGFVRYEIEPSWFPAAFAAPSNQDSHYIAFSTDRDIDKLLSADVFFVRQSFTKETGSSGNSHSEYGAKVSDVVTINFTDTFIFDNSTVFYDSTKTLHCIQSSKSFISSEDLQESVESEISHMDWVVRFYLSSYNRKMTIVGALKETSMIITDVSLFRLKFETDGIVYNLGVVDNKTSGDDKPDNNDHDCILWKLLAYLILACLVSFLFNQLFPWFYPLLGKIISGAFKALWYIVSFQWLRDLIRWKKGKHPQQVVVVNSTNNKRKRKGKKKPPTK